VRNVASRLPSTVARHPSSGICSIGAGGVKLPPALRQATSAVSESALATPVDAAATRLAATWRGAIAIVLMLLRLHG